MATLLAERRQTKSQEEQVPLGPRANNLFVRLYVLMAGLGFALGGAFALGGSQRFASPAFEGARDLVAFLPGQAHVWWGGLFIFYGVLLVAALGRRVAAIHVLRFGVVVYLFLTTSFISSVVFERSLVLADGSVVKAALSGIVAYGSFAIAHLILSDHLTHKGWEGC